MSGMQGKQNPFPGLRPFTQEEDYLFFGREEQTIELLQRLAGNRFVAVVGTSGSGKSSLVRCGLLSELLGGKMLKAGASWEVAVTHPGGNPMALLTEALLEADLYDIEEDHARENLLATLNRSHFGLVEAIRQSDLGEGTNLLLVVDQFEEIFRFHEAGQLQQEIANEFVSLLLEAAAQSEIPIYIVLTMRSDFIGECGEFEGLAEMVNRGEFLIPRLTREQYKRVIEGPVKVAGGKIAPRLLQRLLNDLGQQADQLPCLQHALMRTWDVCAARQDGDALDGDALDSDALDLDDYQRVGKMAEAMSLHADEIYDSLDSERQRNLCRGLFQALTIQETENRGIRRPQRLAALCNILEVEADDLRPIIDAFRQSGVTFLIPPDDVELDETNIIDISHESLMRVWVRLRGWVEEEAQAAGIYRRLSESATLHAQDKAGLYRDPELGIALAWKEASHPNQAWADRYSPGFDSTMAYLDESHQAAMADELELEAARQHELEHAQQLAQMQSERAADQARAAVRLRWLVRGVGVVAIIALLASIFALFARRDAQRHATVAERRAAEADLQRENALVAQSATATALTQAEQAKANALLAEQRSREFRYATDMELASVLLHDQSGDVTQALSRLVDHDPEANEGLDEEKDLRGFEWHYLKRLIDARARIFSGYEASLIDVTLTPDGQIVGLDEDGWVHRWDATTRESLGDAVNTKGKRDIAKMALSPDGSLVALAAKTGPRVWLIDAVTGQPTENEIPFASGNALTFSPDGKMLITVGASAAWWDVDSGKPIAIQIDSTMDREGPISLSADGRTLAISRQGNSMGYFYVLRMNPETREVETLIDKKASGGSLGPIAVSADGKSVVVTQMFQGSFVVFDTSTGLQVAQNALAHAGPITSVTFNPEGEELASASQDGVIKVWKSARDVETPAMAFSGHAEPVNDLCFVSHGTQLVSSSSDLTTRLWDRSQKSDGLRQSMPHANGFQASFSTDGLLLAVADFKRSPIHLYDSYTLRPVRSFERKGKGLLTSVAFSPDGRILAAGFGLEVGGSQVELWDIDKGERVAVLAGASDVAAYDADWRYGVVSSLAFSPDGKRLVAGFGHRFLYSYTMKGSIAKVWDVESRREVTRLKGHDNLILAAVYSSDGRWVATASYDGTTRIWNTADWETEYVLDNPDAVTEVGQRRMLSAAFSPDSSLLATASHEGNVHVWSVETGELVKTLKGHANGVDSVVFSPDGRTIASAASDQTVRLWNVATWRELTRLEVESANATAASLTFSPDGSRLFSSCSGVRYWEIGKVLVQQDELADSLARTLGDEYDFQARVRMLSDHPDLANALRLLAERHPDREPIAKAIATTRLNQLASSEEWSETLEHLSQIPAESVTQHLGAPLLLRSARAFFEQGKSIEASELLRHVAKRLASDGVMGSEEFGIRSTTSEKGVQIIELTDGYPAEKSGLLVGDVIETVNGESVTGDSVSKYASLINAELGELTRLGVRRDDAEELIELEVLKQVTLNDSVISDLIRSFEEAVDARLEASQDPTALLEVRGELAGLWPDRKEQLSFFTAAIESLSAESADSDANAMVLARLHARRGDALVGDEEWSDAVDDYSTAKLNESADIDVDEETMDRHARAKAEIMLARAGDWTYLKPIEFESTGGANLELLDDTSILASGKNPATDTYVVELETDLKRITALRLEALTHDSLPNRGPGRALNVERGGFRLSDLAVEWAPLGNDKPSVVIPLDDVLADYNLAREELTVKQWNIASGTGKDHFAVYKLKSPIKSATGIRLTVAMTFHDVSPWTDQNLGRFRLSANDQPDAFKQARVRNDIANKLAKSVDDDPWSKLAFAHHLIGDDDAVTVVAKQHPDSCESIGNMYATAENFRRAIEVYNLAINDETTDIELISARASAHEQLDDWESAEADWARAMKLATNPAEDEGHLSAEFARRLAKAGQRSRAMRQFDLSRRAIEAEMKDFPDSESLLGRLAAVFANQSEPIFSTLKPLGETTEARKTLKLGKDDVLTVESTSETDDDQHEESDAIVFAAPEDIVLGLKIETSSSEEPDDDPLLDQYQLSMILEDPASEEPARLHGRYVRVAIEPESTSTTMSLAEVQVFQIKRTLLSMVRPVSQALLTVKSLVERVPKEQSTDAPMVPMPTRL